MFLFVALLCHVSVCCTARVAVVRYCYCYCYCYCYYLTNYVLPDFLYIHFLHGTHYMYCYILMLRAGLAQSVCRLVYGLDDQGSVPRRSCNEFFLFATASRPAQGPTQPPVNLVPGGSYSGCKAVTHLHLVSSLRVHGAVRPLLQYVFMAWCLDKHRDNFNCIKTVLYDYKGRSDFTSSVSLSLSCLLLTHLPIHPPSHPPTHLSTHQPTHLYRSCVVMTRTVTTVWGIGPEI
jgi:hypothetical protein